jgi:hypothetical protein
MGEKAQIVRDSAREMDQMIAGVMPATWMGHARLIVEETPLRGSDKVAALEYTERLVEENDYPSDKAMNAVIKQMYK